MKCRNCNIELSSSFCQNCGQRASVDKVTFSETFQDFVDAVFSVNAPLIKTTRLLIVNPGKLFRSYLAGKRKSYYKPVSFFIISTIIYLLIRSLINYNPISEAGVEVKGDDGEIFVDASRFMVKNINNIMFLFVFALGVMLKAFFYKKNSLAEFVAISFYAIGIYVLIGTITMFYQNYWNGPKMTPIILFFIYIIYAFSSFFQSKKILTILKILLVYFLSFALYVVFGFGLSLLIVWLKTI